MSLVSRLGRLYLTQVMKIYSFIFFEEFYRFSSHIGPRCFKQKTEVSCPLWVRKTVDSDGGSSSRAGLLGYLGLGRKASGKKVGAGRGP